MISPKIKLLIFLLTFSSVGAFSQITGSDLKGDTIKLADPTIFYDNDVYYLYGTGSSEGFPVYTSKNLIDWKIPHESENGLALIKGDSFGTKDFWAPQIFKHNGLYYMAYTANENIAIAKSKSPLGPFEQTVIQNISGEHKQIDPYVFIDDDGKKYLYHVKLTKGNRIYVSKLKEDFSDVIPGTEKECIFGVDKWENTANSEWPVAEGPTVLKHNNLYYLFYSANDFRNIDYAVGYAVSDNPLGPWKKFLGNPIISRKNLNNNGPGHGDFFTEKTGSLYYVFHTHYSSDKVSPRKTAIIKAAFKIDASGNWVLSTVPSSFRYLITK